MADLLPERLDLVPLADLFVAAAGLITEARRRGETTDPDLPYLTVLAVANAVSAGMLSNDELERLFHTHSLDKLGDVVREAVRRWELGRG